MKSEGTITSSKGSSPNNSANIEEKESIIEHVKKSSGFEAFLGIVCVVAGSGILGLPLAIAKSGWSSIAIMVLGFVIALYSGNLIISCLYYDGTKRLDSYPDVGYAAFGIIGRSVVQFGHYAIILGGVCLYIMLTGANIHSIALTNGVNISQKLLTFLAGFAVLIAYATIKTLKEAVWFSAFGALTTIIVVVTVVITGFIEMPHKLDVPHDNFIWQMFPSSMATIAFAYGGSVVFPHIEKTMKNRKSWPKILGYGLGSVTVMYLLISIVGYYVYGKHAESPIYKSLALTAPRTVAEIFITLHVLLASPVYLCSFGVETEKYMNLTIESLGVKKEFLYRFLIRSATVIVITLIAAYVPEFDPIMTLIGALANGIIIFLVPVLCHYKLFGYKLPIYTHVFRIVILIVGMLCVVFGTKDAIDKIVQNFSPN